jgi:hypothetical protein
MHKHAETLFVPRKIVALVFMECGSSAAVFPAYAWSAISQGSIVICGRQGGTGFSLFLQSNLISQFNFRG